LILAIHVLGVHAVAHARIPAAACHFAVLSAGMIKEGEPWPGLGLIVSSRPNVWASASHMVGLQAGFHFRLPSDPFTEADSRCFEVMGRTVARTSIFRAGTSSCGDPRLCREPRRPHPAGSWALGPGFIEPVIRLFQVIALHRGCDWRCPVVCVRWC